MSSFKKLKEKLQNKVTPQPSLSKNIQLQPTTVKEDKNLELEEGRYLLALIAKSDFSGKDIQIVYNVALKLQNIIKSYIKEEDGNI
tara:strand:+ start:166 stop:423 length:258 start_codon:yes stop_codon:yes gene_type:complete